MSELDHLLGHQEEQELPPNQLARLVSRYRVLDEEVKKLEHELSEAKEAFNEISQTEIPQFLLQYGVSGVPLSTGEMLSIKQEVSASIKDMPAFAEYVTERGDDDILKTTMVLGKVPAEIAKRIRVLLLQEFDLSADIAQTVHPQTLKKYVKELCGIGMDDPEDRLGDRYVPLQELPDYVSVYTYFKTSLKAKK